jgi:hypothetical protein
MTYTHIQFIGYSIDTAPDEGPPPTYLGLHNPQADIKARCELIERAIRTAHEHLPPEASPPAGGTILKVFMAPEFYLRGDQGAYQMDDVQTAIAGLQTLAADERWADWLFVFGTILGVADPAHPPLTQEIYNFALIQQGGFANSGSKGARVVMKELKSDIDFIAEYPYAGGLLLGQVNPLQAGLPPARGRERQRVNYDGGGIFDLTDVPITFAMDICLDHLEFRMVNSPQSPGEYQVQVQLIPSCGANIDPNGVVAEVDGYVFNVDGHNGSHVVLRRVVPGARGTIPPLASYPVGDDDIIVRGFSPPEVAPIDSLYRDGAGEVVIFDALPIPERRAVPGCPDPIPVWNTPGGYQFAFEIVFDENQTFITIMCTISGGMVDLENRRYFLPLDLHMHDADGESVRIKMRLIRGGGYDYAVWCHIEVPGFDFEGAALQFNDTPRSPPQPPEFIW